MAEKEPTGNQKEMDESEKPTKFGFFLKQPLPVKIVSLLVLLFLVWLALPKCVSTSASTKKTYVIALDSSWYSLRLATKQRDMTTFFKILLNAIATEQQIKMEVIERGPNLFQLLDRKEVDGVISVFPPPGRDIDRFLASDTVYQLGFVLLVRKNSTLTSPEKISGRIGVVGGAEVLAKIPPNPSAAFFRYADASVALSDLENNTIDGVIMDNLQANIYLQGLFASKFTILYPPLINEGIELYLRKENDSEKFLYHFNLGLKNLRDKGQYRELIEHWDLIYTGSIVGYL